MQSKTNSDRRDELLKVGRRVFLAGLVVTATTGCQNIIRRGQSPDGSLIAKLGGEEEEQTNYIGDICGIYGLDFARVQSVGLAVSLDGTGSDAKPGGQREQLIRQLEASNIREAKKLVASLNTEVVLMVGTLPPGIKEGETFDIQVRTLKNTEATSIENGMVLQSQMRPAKRTRAGVRQGAVTGVGRGRVLVDALFDTRKDPTSFKNGVILGGGKVLKDRPLGLQVKGDDVSTSTTIRMARAINARFTNATSIGQEGVAEPKTDRIVELIVPDSYRFNVGRYLGVIRNIAYKETTSERVNRMERLEQEIGQPETAGISAVRLEALGQQGIPALKRALRHHDLEVQFHAAQALAYSDHTDGIDILKKAAQQEPAFRWHALTALSSIDSSDAAAALTDLMHTNSAETRYGAFRALRAHSPTDPLMTGDWLAGDFFLHEIPSQANPMIHFSRSKRPEVVLFGDQQTVADNFLYVKTGLTIRANGNETITIATFSPEFGEEKKVCSNQLSDLIRTLAKQGFGYGPLLKMLKTAKQSDMLQTRLVVNAVPTLGRKYSPDDSRQDQANDGGNSLAAASGSRKQRASDIPRVAEDTLGQINDEIESSQQSRWDKVKSWVTGDR